MCYYGRAANQGRTTKEIQMSYGSLQNLIQGSAKNPVEPKVGMGATLLGWTDRHAGTIIAVRANGKEIDVQRDKAIRTDNHGMSDCQSYRYEPNPDADIKTFTLRKNGRFVKKGEPMRGGQKVGIGYRDEHYDFSF